MQIVKKTSDYTIIKKRSGRYGVRNKHNVWVNGDEKIKILVKEGLIKVSEAKAAPEENTSASESETPAEETASSESSESESQDSSSEATA